MAYPQSFVNFQHPTPDRISVRDVHNKVLTAPRISTISKPPKVSVVFTKQSL